MTEITEKPESGIAPKIFIAISLIGSVIIMILIILSTLELRKFDKTLALAGFSDYEHLILPINVLVYILNITVAVWIHRSRKHGLYFIYALFLFIFFVNLDYFWLISKYFKVKYSELQHPDDVIPMRNIYAVLLNIFSVVFTILIYLAIRNWNRWSRDRKLASQNLSPSESRK